MPLTATAGPRESLTIALRDFLKFMAEHRVCPDTIDPAPDIRYENGQVIADFAAFDKAAESALDELGMTQFYTPSYFYLFGWGFPPSEKYGEKPYEGEYRYPNADRSKLRPQFKQAYQAVLKESWGINWLTYDPYRWGWLRYFFQRDAPENSYYVRYPNGDGFLAYPGAAIGHAGPVTSIRFEQAREGCEDHEYLYLLHDLIAKTKAAGHDAAAAEKALAVAQELVEIPNASGRYSTRILPDPDRVFTDREHVAEAIEVLSD